MDIFRLFQEEVTASSQAWWANRRKQGPSLCPLRAEEAMFMLPG